MNQILQLTIAFLRLLGNFPSQKELVTKMDNGRDNQLITILNIFVGILSIP